MRSQIHLAPLRSSSNLNMVMSNNKTIILVPRLSNPGGVANYYASIKPFLGENVTFLYRGKDGGKSKFYRLISDYYRYIKGLYMQKNFGAVVINHSLGPGGLYRDGIYAFITPKKYKKIVYFRGWNPEFVKKIDNSFFLKKWLEKTFLKAEHIIVLSYDFKLKLIEWGYNRPISIQTTLVDEQLLEGLLWESLTEYRGRNEQRNLLYLGNVARTKGVWEIVDSLKHINGDGRDQNIRLSIAGAGHELEALKKYTEDNRLNVEYLGYVRGKQKQNAYINAHLYVFASYHEGMPNSVLEAMAFGLPVITTRVGGIPDFFENGKMGLFLDNRAPEHIAEKIRYLLERPDLMKKISEYNYHYAKTHFYASQVARRFESIVEAVIKGVNE